MVECAVVLPHSVHLVRGVLMNRGSQAFGIAPARVHAIAGRPVSRFRPAIRLQPCHISHRSRPVLADCDAFVMSARRSEHKGVTSASESRRFSGIFH